MASDGVGAGRRASGHHGLRPAGSTRLFLHWFLLLSAPAMVATAVSFATAVTNGSSPLSISARSVAWLHSHRFGTSPEGAVLATEPVPPASTSRTTTADVSTSTSAGLPAAAGITPIVVPPLPGEGVWQPFGDSAAGVAAMHVARLRADASQVGVFAAVVRIDQTAVSFRIVPGLQQPGGAPWPQGGLISTRDLPNVLAAFNSGFQLADANGGFFENGRTQGALRTGAASLVLHADGTLDIAKWGRDADMSSNPVAVRQNLDLIIDNGVPVTGLNDNTNNRWGKTVGNVPLVWRSGIGIDGGGRIIYAASAGLSAATLATLLQSAGAVRAMELDINYSWVSFNTFHHDSYGRIVGTKLEPGMKKPGTRYLAADPRDFVAVIARQPIVSG